MNRDPQIFLKHIRDSINDIETYIKNVTLEEFLEYKNKEKQDAVVRRIEIIGEAARNIPDDFKKNYHDISWREIAGMRNKLIHEYFGVDLELVWEVVKNDIPQLKKRLEKILK